MMKDEERGGTTENDRLKEWIIMAFPVMARAFSIVIQEHRLDEIPGCRGILESCPIVDNARLLPEIPDGWEEYGNPLRGWIPVEDRLPEWEEPVLVFLPQWHRGVRRGYLKRVDKKGRGWDCMDGMELSYDVTHWRPLPEAPSLVQEGEV